jgi:hypothetical protein
MACSIVGWGPDCDVTSALAGGHTLPSATVEASALMRLCLGWKPPHSCGGMLLAITEQRFSAGTFYDDSSRG